MSRDEDFPYEGPDVPPVPFPEARDFDAWDVGNDPQLDGAEGVPLPAIDMSTWIGRNPPPREFAWGEWLPLRQTTMLTGEGGVGKSLLAQQLLTCSALGLPCLGMETKERPAIYITAEDDEDELWRRQESICKALGVKLQDVSGRLDLVSLCGATDTALASFDANGALTITPRWQQVVMSAKAHEAGLVAFDNATDMMAGDHSSLDQVATFIRLLTGLAIDMDGVSMIIHHPNKAGEDWLGSIAWHNKVRSRLITKRPADCLDPDMRVIENPKANYSASGGSIGFRWFRGAFTRDEDLPESLAEQLASTAAATADNAIFLACLDLRNKQERAVSEKDASRTYAPLVFSKMPESRSIGRKRLETAMDRLFRTGEIERGLLWRADRKDVFGLRRACADVRADPALTECADVRSPDSDDVR